jgi:hypothetical protein
MILPPAVEKLWSELETVRAQIFREVEGLSQRQADWRPGEKDWSVGEIIDHLTLAEVATGKLTSKLLKEAPPSTFPVDLAEFARPPEGPPGPAEAPPAVQPSPARPLGALLAAMRAARERSRESVARLAGCDPRALTWKHFRFGDLDLGQWWRLQAHHDGVHLRQIRDVKAAPGFPPA